MHEGKHTAAAAAVPGGMGALRDALALTVARALGDDASRVRAPRPRPPLRSLP
jgi:hypothetical protein